LHAVPARIDLRPADPGDLAFLQRVYASTREDELAVTGWSQEQKAAFLAMQFQAQHAYYQQHYPQGRFDVIEIDGAPAGRLYVNRTPHEIRIVDIALLPAWRGRGVGSRLLWEILEEASGATIPVTIHVERTNPALALYRRLGFEPAGETGIYWLMRWSPVAAATD
jgi:ribosomal protein S18 acetylase RimI-like enzyme